MAQRDRYKLRDIIPNPEGRDWPETSERHDDAAIELAISALKTTMKNAVLPRLMAIHSGDTKKVASCMATLFVEQMRQFFHENRAEDQKANMVVFDEIISCLTYNAERMQGVAILSAIGIDPVELMKDGADLRIFKI